MIDDVEALKKSFRRHVFDESLLRIRRCLNELWHEQIWASPCERCNSIGVLVLHLIGNASQYMLKTLGGLPYERQRSREFAPLQHYTRLELIERLVELERQLREVVDTLDRQTLQKTYRVQCYEMSGYEIVIHVIEHMSHHAGQIIYRTKQLRNIDLRFYDDEALEADLPPQ